MYIFHGKFNLQKPTRYWDDELPGIVLVHLP